MRTTKIILSILSFIVSTGIALCLVWGLLYLCIPNVKTKTDEIFNKDKTQIEEEKKEEVETASNIKIDYKNNLIKVEV